MASTYTPLGIELMATGENAGTWGTKTNNNLSLLAELTGGFAQVSITGGAQTTALTVVDGATTGTAQRRMIEFTGTITGNQIVTIPNDVETFYFLRNSTSGSHTVQFKYATGSGSTVTFAAADKGDKVVFAAANDGTDPDIKELPSGNVTLTGTQTLTNKTLTSPAIGTSILDTNGNELALLTATGSAVNEFTIANAATGAGPTISSTGGDSNIDINITPKGTGDVVLAGDTVKVGDSGAAATLSSNGAGTLTVTTGGATDLVLNTNSGTDSGSITITDGAGGNITITPNGSGNIVLDGLTFPNADGSADQVLKTNGSGTLSFTDVSGGTSWQAVKTANYTASAGEGVFANTSSSAWTLTLPASPSIGDEVSFIDYAGTFDTNNLTIGRNGQKIAGATADLTVSTERAANTLVFTDSTQGWLLKNK